MTTVTRITPDTTRELAAEDAIVDMARTLMASQARGEMPTVHMSQDGRVTLRWQDGTRVSYLTGVDTGPRPRDAALPRGGATPPRDEETSARPLGISEAVSLAAIVDAATRGATVARQPTPESVLMVCTARQVLNADRLPLGPDDDVRDGLLRVTGTVCDHFWPLRELVVDHQQTVFVIDYRS